MVWGDGNPLLPFVVYFVILLFCLLLLRIALEYIYI